MADIFTKLIGQEPDQVIVPEERFWQAAKDIYTAANWDKLHALLILSAVRNTTPYLTDDIRVLAGAYHRALSGTPQAQDKKKAAFYLAQGR